jgi:hypothetical protein
MSGSPDGSGAGIRCSACGAPMHCGMNDPGGCWCAGLAPVGAALLAPGQGCWCEACLKQRGQVSRSASRSGLAAVRTGETQDKT